MSTTLPIVVKLRGLRTFAMPHRSGRSNTGELIKSLQESDMSIILLALRGDDVGIAEHLHSFTGGSTTLVAGITTFVESSH
jgi:hypothetical protein